MSPVLSCWVISDGRRGIENQALGLGEAVARLHPSNIEQKLISLSGMLKVAQPGLQLALKPKPQGYGLHAPYPQLVIGCGRQAIAPLRALKKHCGTEVFTVYVQDPRINPKHFDLVIAPEHDALTGKNVFSVIGSPNRVTNERIIVDTLNFNHIISTLKAPRIAMLIGGNSKSHKLDDKSHDAHMRAANAILAQNCSLLITASRRTPEFAKDAYQKLASTNVKVWYADSSGENPFFAMLGASDAILVTEDSTNMLTEACATGKPVFTLPMSGAPGKFAQLYERLAQRCNLVPFCGKIDGPPYPALKETERAAREIMTRISTSPLGNKLAS